MYNKLKKLFLFLIFTFLLTLPYFVFAGQSPMGRLEEVGTKEGNYAEANENTLSSNAGMVVNVLLGFLGIVFIVLMIYGGFLWMTAGGNEEQVTKAKGFIKNSIIGLVVVIGAYSIWTFVLAKLI